MSETLLEKDIIRDLAYKKEKAREGYKIPIVSDIMFSIMFNSKVRLKYSVYLISLVLDKNYIEVLNNIKIANNELDQLDFDNEIVYKLGDELINIKMNNNSFQEDLENNIYSAFDLYKCKDEMNNPYNYYRAIQININNFAFKDNERVIETYMLRDESGTIFTDKLMIIEIYLPNIRAKLERNEELTELEKFLLVLNEDKESSEKLGKGYEIMEQYIHEAMDISSTERISKIYNEEECIEEIILSRLKIAEEEGVSIGIEKGIKQRSIEVATSMFNDGIDIDTIMRYTNLSYDEVVKLKQ